MVLDLSGTGDEDLEEFTVMVFRDKRMSIWLAVVVVVVVYSDDPSSNPAEACRFYSLSCSKKYEKNNNRPILKHEFVMIERD